MGNVRLIGCLHLGHEWMAKHRGFENAEEYHQHLIKSWNSVVHKRDLIYILGDVTMETSEHYYLLDQLNGRKIVVLGNHDRHQDIKELLKYVESVAGMIDYKGFTLTHCPIHPNEIGFYKGNFHAHIHHNNKLHEVMIPERYGDHSDTPESTIDKYFNVDAKLIDFKPKTIEELLNIKDESKIL